MVPLHDVAGDLGFTHKTGWLISRIIETGNALMIQSYISSLIARFGSEDEGQGLAEYALILALIAIVAIVALIFLGGQVSGILSNVGKSI